MRNGVPFRDAHEIVGRAAGVTASSAGRDLGGDGSLD
ncbi:MAG: hypothetical protein U5L11_10485 [Arhodomonas sp.]|nr:hypothetical protein [Arhodomonas sp.]